ncbi:MAG: SsrA-binding protein SmpB [Bacilli bacterium]|jgi:SsrA-binding protein|nr:SsrA-binding protein SmpB [Bacilli bacterium]MBR4351021.1 SsrA-binding protein SmpB [Bacilli bacterium]
MEILNKKARYDYEILERYEAGIVLTGNEIKSIRKGSCNLKDSYVIVKNGEVFILGMHISNYKEGSITNLDETRTRKLLLNRKEINKLQGTVEIKGYTIVPVKLYFVNNRAKLEIAVAKGKHTYDKKEAIKKRDNERLAAKELKNYR